MKTLQAKHVVAPFALALLALAWAPPAHATDPTPTVAHASGAFTGRGYWADGLATVSRTMSVGFDGTISGTFTVGTGTVVGAASCSARGWGVESLANGFGTVELYCSGPGVTVYVPFAQYTRYGTTTHVQGTATVRTSSGATALFTLTYEAAPTNVYVPGVGGSPTSAYTAAGVVEAAGARA